jgi:cytochrome b
MANRPCERCSSLSHRQTSTSLFAHTTGIEMSTRILVWDLPTRIFHWTLAMSFAIAFLTAESERWRDIHVLAGYILLGLLAFRLVWGLIGSRYARFSDFVPGLDPVRNYLKSVLKGQPIHYVGHNPLGAVAILALIGLGVTSGVSGWLLYEDVGGEGMKELHEVISNAMLAIVVLHVAGVLIASRLHRENLILGMISGRKRGPAGTGIASPRRGIGMLLVAALTGALTWGWLARSGVIDGAGSDASTQISVDDSREHE